MRRFGEVFEIGGARRSLPMEGLRGIAVGLVFLQHYCAQFLAYGEVSGETWQVAEFFERVGNYGVELFFVLSGFLIYGILLRRRARFFAFMGRRAQRLYPAFIVALLIGAALDPMRPKPKIPLDPIMGPVYLGANLAFLPGLFPINPLFAVNWSLSYEWWFYLIATILFSVFGLAGLQQRWRLRVIIGLAVTLLALSAVGLPGVPIRGLPLFGGMLLAEASIVSWRVPSWIAAGVAMTSALTVSASAMPPWLCALVLTLGFSALASISDGWPARLLSQRHLRWFGNISYSYYLVHGFIVLIAAQTLFRMLGDRNSDVLFWIFLIPVFVATLFGGAALFLLIEKPLSLRKPRLQAATPIAPAAY